MLNGRIDNFRAGFLAASELVAIYNDAYAYLYDNGAPQAVYNYLIDAGLAAIKDNPDQYRAFYDARRDAVISDREVAAYALAFVE